MLDVEGLEALTIYYSKERDEYYRDETTAHIKGSKDHKPLLAFPLGHDGTYGIPSEDMHYIVKAH